jgi:hypothetical protein
MNDQAFSPSFDLAPPPPPPLSRQQARPATRKDRESETNCWERVGNRVRRSYSLKAKTSENVGIFVLALKRKKMFFFALFAIKRNTPNSEKNESENESEAKREAKSYNSVKV